MVRSPPLKVLVVSSVQPEKLGLGGQLILDRLLSHPGLQWKACPRSNSSTKKRLYNRLRRTRFQNLAWFAETFSPLRVRRETVDAAIAEFQPDVLLSVIHGWDFLSAVEASRRWNKPLVLLAQDWWPDNHEVAPLLRSWVGAAVRRACRRSHRVICVSQGMRQALGKLPNSTVLHDLPSRPPSTTRPRASEKFGLIYAGNLYEYGPMVERAARALSSSDRVHLDIYGPEPWWTPGYADQLRASGNYHGLIPPEDLLLQATGYDAALITMSFEPHLRRRMETSFPSKMIELAQLHLPLMIWAPPYSSAVKWAQERDSAICVTDDSPAAVLTAAETLARSTDLQQRLRSASRRAALAEFNPELIHARFVSILEGARAHRSHVV